MSDYGHELRDCLREILGTFPPPPEGDALLFFKQWLAERNLGLVPIDNAATFESPGRWLARIRAADSDHAIVMFGAPSGPILIPAAHSPTAARSRRAGCSHPSTSSSQSTSPTASRR